MKNSIKIVLPLSIISFILFTKWWLVEWTDGGREIIYGFPYPFLANGSTSLTYHFFIRAFIIDIVVYYLFWQGVLLLMHRLIFPVDWKKSFWLPLWFFALFLMLFTSLMWSDGENLYDWNNKRGYKVLKTEFHYVGNDQRRREILLSE